MARNQVGQCKGPGCNPRFGQITYFLGVKTRLSTLGTGDVPLGSHSTNLKQYTIAPKIHGQQTNIRHNAA